MDSGLGSDEDQRRSRTKEQKQRLNEQLIHGAGHCFIDASLLQDEEVSSSLEEKHRSEERRQGALLFQTGINQYSTLLPPAGPSEEMPDTPFNSISHIVNAEDDAEVEYANENGVEDESISDMSNLTIDEENATKPSLGFYVDLNEVAVEASNPTESSSSTKNIFSMVIDFEAPKKDMPTHLFRNTNRRMSNGLRNKSGKQKDGSGSSKTSPEKQNTEADVTNVTVNEENQNNKITIEENCAVAVDTKELEAESETIQTSEPKSDEKPNVEAQKFVKLSDLMFQNTKAEPEICNDIIGPKMSRSIPESSWVENNLLMSRSAGFRMAPRPLEPDSSLSDSTGSQTGPSQRRLGTDLLRMFLEEIDTDTAIHIGNKSIKAHRCILISRCQYFAGSLRSHSLQLEGFSYETVHFSLCHIYSGAAHVPDSINLVELASLADMLSLEGLKEVVSHALKARHCHNFHSPCAGCLTGVLEVLPLTSAYGLDELYQKCLKWITANYLRIWPSRAFASLPRELREKCYQQHVIHMSTSTVFATSLSTDRLLASLPTLKWAEPVVQLAMQLSQACLNYVTQHYVAVLIELMDIEPWNYPKIEELLLDAAKGLSLDHECWAYSRCSQLLDEDLCLENASLKELLERLRSHFEKRLQHKSSRLQRCPKWNNMDPMLKSQIRSLNKNGSESPMTKSMEMKASRLPRMVASTAKTNTSSSESSRNSSPATSQTHTSPSLRRSLLLAARAPQVPPSPNTARRISTLTMPTAASAAKSAVARQTKQSSQQPLTSASSKGNRAVASAKKVPIKTPVSKPTPAATKTTAVGGNSGIRRVSSAPVRRPPSLVKAPEKTKKPASTPKPKQAAKRPAESPQKSPSMQRSSTFLKLEPTVLTKPSSHD